MLYEESRGMQPDCTASNLKPEFTTASDTQTPIGPLPTREDYVRSLQSPEKLAEDKRREKLFAGALRYPTAEMP